VVNKIDLTRPILPVSAPSTAQPKNVTGIGKPSFQELLESELKKVEVQFSKHAKERMVARNIRLSTTELDKLNEAVNKASLKGAKESLILFPHAAFIVNIPNQTVITAVDAESMKENVFTNIDSAVII